MGKQGFLCPWLPEEYGGAGVDFKYSVIIGQELIRGDAMGIGVPNHQDVAVPYIYSFGSEELKQKTPPEVRHRRHHRLYLRDRAERGVGRRRHQDKGREEGRSLHPQRPEDLHHQRHLCGRHGGHVQDRVSRRPDPRKRTSLLVVEGESLKYVKRRQLEKMGRHATDTTELFFDDCPVPVGNLLGEEGKGFKYTMQKFDQERLEICIKSQTYAEECFKEALEYAKVREAFGKPIANFEHISFELAEMATDVEIGSTFLSACVEEFIKGEDITKKVSMAKAWIAKWQTGSPTRRSRSTADTATWRNTAYAGSIRTCA